MENENTQSKLHLIGTYVKDGVYFAKIADENVVGGKPGIDQLRREFSSHAQAASGLRGNFNAAAPVTRLRGGVHEYTKAQVQEQIERLKGTENESTFRLAATRIDERQAKVMQAAKPQVASY